MPLSVRLDQKTESLVGWLARKRRQTKSEVIRDAIGVLAKQEEKGAKKRPYDLVAHLMAVWTAAARIYPRTPVKS